MSDRHVRLSKFLSKYLRHEPEALGLTLAPGGWVLVEMVAQNDKQRFSFDESGTHIRANQGHSAQVDLQLTPIAPPPVLYHGTGHKSVEAILRDGLQKMSRHHVHLSGDVQTAIKVGARHGTPVVLAVDAAAMQRDGLVFYRSANGVWLTDHVPPAYLRLEKATH